MKFDYTTILSLAPDTGDSVVIFRPEIRVTVYGSRNSGDFLALVDTGADNTILPESVARNLGIELLPCKGPDATVFGGQGIALFCADVELELAEGDERLRWPARVYFTAADAHDETIILGRQGFLDYFTATFDGEACVLDLQANSYLPNL